VTAVIDAPEPRAAPLRPLRAALRVAREIASDLYARKLAHAALVGLLLILGITIYIVHNQIVQGAAATARQLRLGGAVDDAQLAAFLGRNTGAAEYWSWLVGSVFLSALFAPPLLEPRRSALLFAQPVSRGDVASGIFTAVFTISAGLYAAFGAALFLALRLLGLPVPAQLLLVPIPAAVAFAALYAGVLLATYAWPSGLFAGIFGLASLLALSIAGNADAAQPHAAQGLAGFIHGLLPKIIGLHSQAMRVGGGHRLQLFPIASTLAYALALLLVVHVVARRSER
jgi:hypothetical protein